MSFSIFTPPFCATKIFSDVFCSPRRALSQAAEVKARDELFGKFDGIVERSMKGDLFWGFRGFNWSHVAAGKYKDACVMRMVPPTDCIENKADWPNRFL